MRYGTDKTCYFHKFVFSLDLNPNISSFSICPKQFATSFKMFLDNWNIQTALWLKRWMLQNRIILTEHASSSWNLRKQCELLLFCLRRVCYERCPYNPTAATFLLSAIWHGVYPGYYLTFVTGIAVTMAARAVSILYIRWSVETRFKSKLELYHKGFIWWILSLQIFWEQFWWKKYCYIWINWTLVFLNNKWEACRDRKKTMRTVKVIIHLVMRCIKPRFLCRTVMIKASPTKE